MTDDEWTNVRVDDGSFLVSDPGEIPVDTLDFSTGLIGIMDEGAMICAGVHTGVVRVRAVVSSHAPADFDLTGWDDVSEASVMSASGQLRVRPLYDAAPPDLPLLSVDGPGSYRIRVHARGRDISPGGVEDTPVEDYYIMCWATPPSSALILRATDARGMSMRISEVRPLMPPSSVKSQSSRRPDQEPMRKPDRS